MYRPDEMRARRAGLTLAQQGVFMALVDEMFLQGGPALIDYARFARDVGGGTTNAPGIRNAIIALAGLGKVVWQEVDRHSCRVGCGWAEAEIAEIARRFPKRKMAGSDQPSRTDMHFWMSDGHARSQQEMAAQSQLEFEPHVARQENIQAGTSKTGSAGDAPESPAKSTDDEGDAHAHARGSSVGGGDARVSFKIEESSALSGRELSSPVTARAISQADPPPRSHRFAVESGSLASSGATAAGRASGYAAAKSGEGSQRDWMRLNSPGFVPDQDPDPPPKPNGPRHTGFAEPSEADREFFRSLGSKPLREGQPGPQSLPGIPEKAEPPLDPDAPPEPPAAPVDLLDQPERFTGLTPQRREELMPSKIGTPALMAALRARQRHDEDDGEPEAGEGQQH